MQVADYPKMDVDTDNRSASVIQIDNGKHIVAVAICSALSAICACFAVFAFYQATLAERESRMASYYLTELDHTLVELKISPPDGGYEAFKRKE
jgi:hypothetical protein